MKTIGYAALCLIWGTTWLAIRVGMHGIGPLTAAGVRFLIAGGILYLVAAVVGRARPLRALPWRLVSVLAVFSFALDYGLVYIAETRLDSGLVAVLFSALPFFTLLFSRTMLGERISFQALVGTVVAFGGICFISLTGSVHAAPLFALFVILAAASSSFTNVYVKRHGDAEPLTSLPPAMLIGGAAMLVVGLVCEPIHWREAISPTSIGALLYLSIVGSALAFFLLLWLIDQLPAITVGLFAFIIPIIALAVGALFGGEHVDARIASGSLLVVVGVAITLLRFRANTESRTDRWCDEAG